MKLLVVGGDILVFALFPLLGSTEHAGLGLLGAMARTTLPFSLVWAVASPIAGVYRPAAQVPGAFSWRLLPRLALATAFAVLAGMVLRAWWFERPWAWSFLTVALLVHLAMLTAWRVIYTLIARRILEWRRAHP